MTKIPAEILELARQGGWQDREGDAGFARTPQRYAQVALDREFWIALGKKSGWQMVKTANYGAEVHTYWAFDSEWQAKAHEFYQCVLSGQDPTEFWASFVKDN